MTETMVTRSDLERIALPTRVGAIGLVAILVVASILAGVTARECHFNLVLANIAVSVIPSVLYGFETWFWWVGVATCLWLYAKRHPAFLHFSRKGGLFHLGLGSLLLIPHLALLQQTVLWNAETWPAWGRLNASLHLFTARRCGLEVMIYGFIYVFCALLYSQHQTQQTLFQKLAVERQLSEAQLKALQMQIEPHFLFNTLNAITSLMAQGRNPEALKTMAHLNTILRTTLQRKAPEKVPFVEELRVIESYLAIQQVRFAGRLQVMIDATPEAMDGLVPCFLLQPIVENAIQHGIAPKAAGGLVETHVKRVGDMLWMQVRDNGRGPSAAGPKGHGIGIENTRERLAYFYPDTHKFHATASTGGGYEVTIQIPYERRLA